MVVLPETTGVQEILCRGYYKHSKLAACFSLYEASGFGGVEVLNKEEDKQKPIGGTTTSNKASNNEPTKRERRVSRAAVIEPLFFSALFCSVEFLTPLINFIENPVNLDGTATFQIEILWNSIDVFIGYFAATLISMVVFMFLQQYYYKCFAGIDDDKSVFPLGTVFVIYLVFFVLYLSHKNILTKWITLVFTLLAGITVWKSLRTDVRKIENKPTQDNCDSSVFSG